MLKRWVFGLAPLAGVCATMAVVTPGASASGVNVLTAIHQQNRVVISSGVIARIKRLESGRKDRANALKLARAYDVYARDIEHAASVVSHSSADSARQATGRHDWVLAARDVARTAYKFGHAFRDLAHGDRAGAAKLVRVADQERSKALANERKAIALLT